MPGAGNVSRFSIFSNSASDNAPWFGGGNPSSSLLQGHQAQVCFLTQFGCLYLCLNLWFNCLDISWWGSKQPRQCPPFYWGMMNRRESSCNLSSQCGPRGCCHTKWCANQWRRDVTQRALMFFTEVWLKVPPAVIPTQPAMRKTSRGSF